MGGNRVVEEEERDGWMDGWLMKFMTMDAAYVSMNERTND